MDAGTAQEVEEPMQANRLSGSREDILIEEHVKARRADAVADESGLEGLKAVLSKTRSVSGPKNAATRAFDPARARSA
jgi:hypothetical protein